MIREIFLQNRLSDIQCARHEVIDLAKSHGFAESTSAVLQMVVDEILSNIIQYGYEDQNEHEIQLRVHIHTSSVTLEFIDTGVPFDPTARTFTNVHQPIDQRSIGGLGIHFVNNMIENMVYDRTAGKNHLTIELAI